MTRVASTWSRKVALRASPVRGSATSGASPMLCTRMSPGAAFMTTSNAGSRATTVYSLGQAARAAAATSSSCARDESTCTPTRSSSASEARRMASMASGGQSPATADRSGVVIGGASLSKAPPGAGEHAETEEAPHTRRGSKNGRFSPGAWEPRVVDIVHSRRHGAVRAKDTRRDPREAPAMESSSQSGTSAGDPPGASTTPPPHARDQYDKGLKTGALGRASSVVIGVASTAPAYSLAATLGLVAAAVGLYSPAIMIVAFIPMLLIAAAYYYMNKADPDCGTTFSWVTRAMGPRLGWMGGWGIIVTDIIVMPNLAAIAGQYPFSLFGNNNPTTFEVTLIGVIWIVVMTAICYIGIELSARTQQLLLGTEFVI